MTSMLVHGPLQQMLGKYTTSKDGMYAPSTRTLTITCSSPALIHTTSSTFAVSVVLKEYHPWALVLMSSEKLQRLQNKGSWLSFELAVMLCDRQWNEFAKTAFTEAVLEEMNIKGFKNEAQWCSMKHFYQACDEPCISIKWHLDIRNHLFQFAHLDISHHLDSMLQTYPLPSLKAFWLISTEGSSCTTGETTTCDRRAVSSLDSENFVPAFQVRGVISLKRPCLVVQYNACWCIGSMMTTFNSIQKFIPTCRSHTKRTKEQHMYKNCLPPGVYQYKKMPGHFWPYQYTSMGIPII